MLNSVMIVDDSTADRYIAKWSFEEKMLADHIIEVRDGSEALDTFLNYDESKKKYGDKFPPTLILLDINMPKMNGFDFLDRFSNERNKNKDHYDSVVVMMFTSSALEEDKEKAMSYEFVKDYLTKPLTPEGIEKVVKKHFK